MSMTEDDIRFALSDAYWNARDGGATTSEATTAAISAIDDEAAECIGVPGLAWALRYDDGWSVFTYQGQLSSQLGRDAAVIGVDILLAIFQPDPA